MFKCVDAKGKVYYTQIRPRECLGRETEELSSQGNVTKRTGRTLTPEQRAEQEKALNEQQRREDAAREERRKNRALLSTYSHAKDIEEARARALKDNERTALDTEKRIAEAEMRRNRLAAEKEFYVKKPMPPKLVQDLKNNEIEIRDLRVLLEAKKKQVAGINAKYDKDKRRYIELTRDTASPTR